MLGRTFIFRTEDGALVKRRVDAMYACPYFEKILYFDAHNTWVDFEAIAAVLQGLTAWKFTCEISSTGEAGDLFCIGDGSQRIALAVRDGKFVLTDEIGSDTVEMEAMEATNDGQNHLLELDVTGSDHNLFLDGVYLNRTYLNGTAVTPLPLPASISEAVIGQGVHAGYFAGTIRRIKFYNAAGDLLIDLPMNEGGSALRDRVSGNFAYAYNAFWEDNADETPELREVLNVYVCNTAGQWSNAHIG